MSKRTGQGKQVEPQGNNGTPAGGGSDQLDAIVRAVMVPHPAAANRRAVDVGPRDAHPRPESRADRSRETHPRPDTRAVTARVGVHRAPGRATPLVAAVAARKTPNTPLALVRTPPPVEKEKAVIFEGMWEHEAWGLVKQHLR